MIFERIQQRYPKAYYSEAASAVDLAALVRHSERLAAAVSPLYEFSDGFEEVIRDGEVHLQLFAVREFERSGEFIVIGTDTMGFDLVVDLSIVTHPVSWHCSFSRPLQAERCELLLDSIDRLLDWMRG
jgi:hypothetical protein